MSTTTATTSATSSSASATCTGNQWVLPVQDAACAVPATGNYSSIMDKCCSPAKVTDYNDKCGIYCLAQKQSVDDLLTCIADNGAKDGEYFCSGNKSATATAAVPTSSETGSKTSGTGSSASSTSTDSAGVVGTTVSKGGLGLLGLMFCSALLGVVA